MDYPTLRASNLYIENFFRYRWENIKQLSFRPNGKIYKHPGIFEGMGCFQKHIAYSAWAHMREVRWLKSPAMAQGSLLNFVAHQRRDGSFPGHLNADSIDQESFYHSDWGKAVLELNILHPDSKFLNKIYPALARYVEYFKRERDPEDCGLYDVWNHYETGQEFSPRYTAIDANADRKNWGKVFRLKGVDVTVYLYNLYKGLAEIAKILGKTGGAQNWETRAEKTKNAVLLLMWNSEKKMFFDVNPKTMEQTGVKALTCFYPYMTDIVSIDHLAGLKKHLFNREEFWTSYPFPTLSLDDQNFSPEGIWRGKKEPCPWNGRVWPMANSHTAEAIASCAIRFNDRELRKGFVELFLRWIRMMCFEKNPERPNSFEHYHPFNGTPSTEENGFGGYNNYLHSWINDLIIKYVAGLRPLENDGIIVDPFPFYTNILLKDVMYRGQVINVAITAGRISVWRDKNLVGVSSMGIPMELTF